jgi:mannose-6-phosphate isomerase
MTTPYPLTFVPHLLPKVWGGERLATLGKPVRAGSRIGESWEIADLPSTSISGAGGGSISSPIASGELKGQTLSDAMRLWKHELATPYGDSELFPLLVKFLDARENLSIQVHPSPAFAKTHPDAALKTECWFIIDAEPGSVIYKGIRPGISPDEVALAIRAGRALDVVDSVPAIAGECHNLPSGTLHALGAGVLVAEIQTPSDTTFRAFDWGRFGRELHIEEAVQCTLHEPAPPAVPMHQAPPAGHVLTTEHFRVWRVSCAHEEDLPVGHSLGCFAVIALSGSGSLFSEEGEFIPVDLYPGSVVLVPAALAANACLRPGEQTRLDCLIAALPR